MFFMFHVYIVHEMEKHIIMLACISTNCCSIKVTIEILYLSSSTFESWLKSVNYTAFLYSNLQLHPSMPTHQLSFWLHSHLSTAHTIKSSYSLILNMKCLKFLCPKNGYPVLLDIGARIYKGKMLIINHLSFQNTCWVIF